MVSQLVPKFMEIEKQFKDTDTMRRAIQYYREFNKDVIANPY